MEVRFKRTGERRYAVIVAQGGATQRFDPAPGYDDDIPHDLVHYAVEAVLGLDDGVFGRAAQGGGTFIAMDGTGGDARAQARLRRKQRRREESMQTREGARQQMALSERLAALCDVAWRRRHGQRADPSRSAPALLSRDDVPRIERVLQSLDTLAPRWRALPIGEELVFDWPSIAPRAH